MECRHFVDCIDSGQRPLSDAEDGLAVVRVLEAACESLRSDGRLLDIAYPVLEA